MGPSPVDDDEMSGAFVFGEGGKVTGVRRWIEQACPLGQCNGCAHTTISLKVEHVNVHRGQSKAK
jgi:hypothetical protein